MSTTVQQIPTELARGGSGSPTVRIIQLAESWGGMEHNNTQLAVRLARRGIRVKITTVGEKAYSLMPARYADQVEVEEIPWPLERPLSFRDWYRLMRARPADIAVFPKNWWAKGGVGMMAAAGLLYSRVVVREHVAVPELPRPAARRGLSRPALWHLRHLAYGRLLSAVPDRIICVSQTVRDRLVDGCAFPASRTVTVHNGVDTRIFRFDPALRRQYRQRHGIPEGATVFGAVGRIDNSHKRHDLSLRQFARLVRLHPGAELHFLLVGDGTEREEMIRLAAELGVSDRFTLAPFTSDPWEAYGALDVFLMPSAFEAFGLALAEAMACERCVIGMAVEGIAEILGEPGIGWAVLPDDEEAFFRAMREALALSEEERRAMGARARESVVRRFDADQQYERIIAHVLGDA